MGDSRNPKPFMAWAIHMFVPHEAFFLWVNEPYSQSVSAQVCLSRIELERSTTLCLLLPPPLPRTVLRSYQR